MDLALGYDSLAPWTAGQPLPGLAWTMQTSGRLLYSMHFDARVGTL